jgi:methionine--tRNA ligase beta chain
MDTISYEDFAKLDIRVGTIKEAKEHPDADKLLILKIDEGKEELRQLVAGIKEYYAPDELIGKQMVFLANLEPKELRGELSQGMILAAGSPEKKVCVLIVPEKEIPNNTKIS